jgi:hypothetical protein
MAQLQTQPEETMPEQGSMRPNGEAAAALLAAGIGSLALGVVTTLSEAIPTFAASLNWMKAVGPLSGKTIIAVVVWLLAWGVLFFVLHKKQVNFSRSFILALLLVGGGLLGTFPPFFDVFVR